MSNYTDGKGKTHQGPPRIASLTEKATKFRRKAGLPSLKRKLGSDNITNYIKSLLPQGAETLEELKGDLDPEEVKASRAMNAGRYPNRRRKAKREEEARAKEENMNQLGDQEGHQSNEIDSALIPAVTGGTSANAGLGAPLVNRKINKARGLKRGLSEVSPEAYSEDGPRPSKIQKCGTAAIGMINPPMRRSRKSRNTNTVFKQPQKAAKGRPPFSLEVNALQPGFQEDGASFNQSYSWSSLALDDEEVANRTPAARSNVIKPKPWHATRAFDRNCHPSLADDVNALESKSGRVEGFGHLESSYHPPYASYRTDQYTSHSNLPAHHMMVAASSQWNPPPNTPLAESNTTAAPRVLLDHVMVSTYTDAGPDRHQYPYQDSYQYSEGMRSPGFSCYTALSSNKSPYTSSTVH